MSAILHALSFIFKWIVNEVTDSQVKIWAIKGFLSQLTIT